MSVSCCASRTHCLGYKKLAICFGFVNTRKNPNQWMYEHQIMQLNCISPLIFVRLVLPAISRCSWMCLCASFFPRSSVCILFVREKKSKKKLRKLFAFKVNLYYSYTKFQTKSAQTFHFRSYYLWSTGRCFCSFADLYNGHDFVRSCKRFFSLVDKQMLLTKL